VPSPFETLNRTGIADLNTLNDSTLMVSSRELFFLCLSLYVAAANQLAAVKYAAWKIVTAISNYLQGLNNQWYFLSGCYTPIPATLYRNRAEQVQATHRLKWIYDSDERVLARQPTAQEELTGIEHFDLLSITIQIGDREFQIDEWFEHFQYEKAGNNLFNPRLLATCWSIDSKIWFTSEDSAFVHIIDDFGERHSFSLSGAYDVEEWLECFGYEPLSATDSEMSDESGSVTEEDEETEDEVDDDEEENLQELPQSDDEPDTAEEQPDAAQEQPDAAEEQSERSDTVLVETD
jgi:hypothetical protein